MFDVTLRPVGEMWVAKARGATAGGQTPAEALGNLVLRLAELPSSGVVVLTIALGDRKAVTDAAV